MLLLAAGTASAGTGMTLAMVESSSGAASAAAMKPRDGLRASRAGTACRRRSRAARLSRYWNRVTTPKLPPPPRIAQNRSGLVSASTRRSCPSAVTISAASSVVDRQAVLADEVADAAAGRDPADARPSPVSPKPIARPCSAAALVTSAAVRPASAQAVLRRRRCRWRSCRAGRARCRLRSCCGPRAVARRSGPPARGRSRGRG